jgi:lysophospholipase L1-like esterase
MPRRVLAALIALSLSGCVHPQPSAQPPGTLVALGSSFAAGPGIGPIKPDTPERCSRSPLNYATQAASTMHMELVDVSCGGATTAHILGPWSELPAQIDAVKPGAGVVTITIGGNDLGYVRNLFSATCKTGEGWTYQGRQVPCPPPAPPKAEDFTRLDQNLRALVTGIRQRAPKARIIFVQYVRLVPDVPCPALGLSPEGAMLARSIGEQLARATARVAQETGAEVLPMDRLSRGHTPCDAEPWSVGSKPLGEGANTPWHPNRAGMTAIADALVTMLKR